MGSGCLLKSSFVEFEAQSIVGRSAGARRDADIQAICLGAVVSQLPVRAAVQLEAVKI